MYRAALFFLTAAIVAVFLGSAVLVLRSCAVVLPGGWALNFCPAVAQGGVPVDRSHELQRQIRFLERRLAQMQCPDPLPISVPEPPVRPEPPPEPPPEPVVTPPELTPPPAAAQRPRANGPIDAEDWADRDLAAMQGCWNLDSDFATRDVRTGAITHYDVWQMCFDDQGNGYQAMQGDDGRACNAAVTGVFDADGAFVVSDPEDVGCTDGSIIFRRETSCTRNADGTATCMSIQPGQQTRQPVQLRPASRE